MISDITDKTEMLTKVFFLALACLASLSLAQQKKAYEPVNRLFTAESDVPRPDLECVVGVDSMAVSELYRVKCTDAWNISVEIDQKKANMWFADNHISDQDRIRRTVRYCIIHSDQGILTHQGEIQDLGVKCSAWKVFGLQ